MALIVRIFFKLQSFKKTVRMIDRLECWIYENKCKTCTQKIVFINATVL